MEEGAVTRSFTCFGSMVTVVLSACLSTISVADSLASDPVSVWPFLSVIVTTSKPAAM